MYNVNTDQSGASGCCTKTGQPAFVNLFYRLNLILWYEKN